MRLNTFLSEKKGERAHREAIAMGLQYKGFGYWADPQTGEAKYKTVNDQLVPVEPDEESDLYKGDEKEEPSDSRSKNTMSVGGGRTSSADMGISIGSGERLGGPRAGMPAAPKKDVGWEAGPDGDTCVGDQEKPEVPLDTFVGKTNFMKWTAGPDGSNAVNMELGEMRQWISEGDVSDIADMLFDKKTPKQPTRKGRLQKANWTGKSQGKPLIPNTEDLPDDRPRPGAGTMMKQAIGAQKVDPEGKFGRTLGDAQSAGKKLRKDHPTIFGNQIAAMLRIKNQDKRHPDQETFDHQMDQQNQMWRKALKLPAVLKDADVVKGMNGIARDLVQNPDYDLDQWDSEEPVDSGSFGSFTLGDDGIGVKQGYIGPGELAALHAMRDHPSFPNLINARFESPFRQMSSYYNNPMNADNDRRRTGQEEYWDPDKQSDWDRQYPGAEGKYAMSIADGEQLFNVWDEMNPDMQQKALENFWSARAALHQKGYSHNDMHGGNIFVDPDTGKVSIIDLGLAKDDPLSALMEATGGMDFEEGNDYQLAHQLSGSNLPEDIRNRFTERLSEIEEMLMDAYDGDEEDEEAMDNYNHRIADVLRGDLRMKKEDLEYLREDLPKLKDRDFVMSLINRLYEGTAGSELQRRMAAAYDERKKDTDIIAAADRIRGEKGMRPLTIRNKNVIPPRNLDIDD